MKEERMYMDQERTQRELLILSHLRQNARIKLTDLSRKTRIPVSSLFDKITALKEMGAIKKFTSLINFDDFGYRTKALILFSTQRQNRDKLLELLNKNSHVNSLYKINNGFDYMVEVILPGMKEAEDFIEGIEEQIPLKKKIMLYILDELKKEMFLSNPATVKLSGEI